MNRVDDLRIPAAQGHINAHGHPFGGEQGLAEAMTDLRFWARKYGVSFAKAIEESFVRMIHDQVNKENRDS
jgi:hypothetical protein